MEVLLNDPPRSRNEGPEGFMELAELQERADIITLHVPLNREGEDRTWHMVDEAFFQKLKRGVILINSSRGEVVDEKALMSRIRHGSLGDVVLDVFEGEPRVHSGLLSMLTLATPHIAGYSLDGKANGTRAAVRAVSQFFNLGLDNWEPADLPAPEPSELLADASQGSPEELLWELYRQTYDVTEDDRRLRSDPSSFEELRGAYPPRREPPAYAVRLFQGYREIIETLEKLGFSVLSEYCA
jgi:erythronate-4-phosphate dehydrogenase